MSRTRAKTDPFWAVSLSNMTAAGQRFVRGLHALIGRSPALASIIWLGSGYRTGSKEHSSGRALDIIVTETTGRMPTASERAAALALVAWLIANAKILGIQWVLFSRDGKPRTESWNADRGTWRALEDRGGVSANHVDHIHVLLKPDAAGWSSVLDSATVGATTAAPPAVPKPAPPASSVLKRGSTGQAVKTLQHRLNVIFPAYRYSVTVGKGKLLAVDAVFGAATEAWVKEFQRRVGIKVDGIVGPVTRGKLAGYGITL